MAARWLRTACTGFFADFGITFKRERLEADLLAFSEVNQISGSYLRIDKSGLGSQLELPGEAGAAIRFRFEGGAFGADLSLSPDHIAKIRNERRQFK